MENVECKVESGRSGGVNQAGGYVNEWIPKITTVKIIEQKQIKLEKY